jgi:hypothetical protein
VTARHVYVLTCDAPRCVETFTEDLTRAAPTRAAAAVHGWVHHVVKLPHRGGPNPSVDLCPEHRDCDPQEHR